jgi:hypothetical protein
MERAICHPWNIRWQRDMLASDRDAKYWADPCHKPFTKTEIIVAVEPAPRDRCVVRLCEQSKVDLIGNIWRLDGKALKSGGS